MLEPDRKSNHWLDENEDTSEEHFKFCNREIYNLPLCTCNYLLRLFYTFRKYRYLRSKVPLSAEEMHTVVKLPQSQLKVLVQMYPHNDNIIKMSICATLPDLSEYAEIDLQCNVTSSSLFIKLLSFWIPYVNDRYQIPGMSQSGYWEYSV